jgi:2,5-furandicarboxylate decarboxylase 1
MEKNELEVAGGLLGEPLKVTRAETADIPIPADAEIVIEGVIDPVNMGTDGPFAEYAGYYGEERSCYLIDVTGITMRKDAIYHGLDPAHREHNVSLVLSHEANVYETIKRRIPSLKAVHSPPGAARHLYYVSIAKRTQGEGTLAGLLAIGAEAKGKLALVVDEDVDIYNEDEIIWAIATRVSGEDINVVRNIEGGVLDPRAYGERGHEKGYDWGEMMGKMIIDATLPVSLPYAKRITPPKELWQSMKLEDYF